jgi:hypothetical protein
LSVSFGLHIVNSAPSYFLPLPTARLTMEGL